MNKNVAIIGGSGFIGCNLASFFVDKEYDVLVVSRTIDISKFKNNKIKKIELDVNFTSKLIENICEFDNVIWLVNNIVPSTNMDSLADDFTFNVNPLVRFLEANINSTKMKRFVFLSSGGTIYGDSDDKTSWLEEDQKIPISAYGLSKIISEEYIQFLTKKSSFESFILRPSNVYGIHQNLKKPQGIIGFAFNAILNSTSIDLYDNGSVTRDFIYITDLAEAIHSCLEKQYKKASINIYNVGSNIGYKIIDILLMINKVSNNQIITNPKPERNFDCNYNVLNNKKINHDLNWYPKVGIEQGLKYVWEWITNENK
jgi:UDP-glucose 4-epimerase